PRRALAGGDRHRRGGGGRLAGPRRGLGPDPRPGDQGAGPGRHGRDDGHAPRQPAGPRHDRRALARGAGQPVAGQDHGPLPDRPWRNRGITRLIIQCLPGGPAWPKVPGPATRVVKTSTMPYAIRGVLPWGAVFKKRIVEGSRSYLLLTEGGNT